jgi:hypothetical protein
MSALGFGVFVGCAISGLIIPRAFRSQEAKASGCIVLGMIAVVGLALPTVFGTVPDFIIGALVIPVLLAGGRWQAIQAISEELEVKRAEAKAAYEARELRRSEAAKAEIAWIGDYATKGWKYVSRAKLMHASGQPNCVFMMSDNDLLLQICSFETREEFLPGSPIVLNVNQVLGLNIAKPKITKTREKIVPVSIVENKRKSPVGRGLVGGALLGPAGLVLGAASGLNSKTSTKVEERTVTEQYETEGDPQLIIGTSIPDEPVLKIKFDPPSLADEWLFRIQGAQSRCC